MTYGKIPDFEAIVVKILNDSSSIAEIAGADCASTELPPDAQLPRLRITLAGGSPQVRGWLHSARILVEAWGTTKMEAFDLIAEACSVLENTTEGALFEEGVVTSLSQDSGLSWSPDPATNTARYLVGFVGYIHPNP
jgi:hypothetical protein